MVESRGAKVQISVQVQEITAKENSANVYNNKKCQVETRPHLQLIEEGRCSFSVALKKGPPGYDLNK